MRLLREDGILVYSTCTFAEAENEAQIARLIAEGLAEPWPCDHLEPYQSEESCYRLWPQLHQCAGSFAGVVRISRTTAEMSTWNEMSTCHRATADVRPPADATLWFTNLDSAIRLWQNDSILIGWPDNAPAWVEQVAIAGPELAHRTGQTWKPAHAAALRRGERAKASQQIELDPASAKAFLRGETVPVATDGWQLAAHRGRPLGWIKGTAGIGKNHLPMSARILGELV